MNRERQALIDRLEQSGKDYLGNLLRVDDSAIYSASTPSDWTIHQIAAHMRDTDKQVILYRLDRILNETHPAVTNFDQEAWNREHYSTDEPISQIIAEFRSTRRKIIRLYHQAPIAAWNNWAVHSQYGKISLDWLAMHCYHHTLEHIAQLGYAREKVLLRELNR